MPASEPLQSRFPSVVHALFAAARERPEGIALRCRERSLSYLELGRAVSGLARELRGFKGAPVAVALPNSIEAVVAVFGVFAARAQLVMVNPFLTVPELAVVLAEAEPALVIAGPEAAEKLRTLEPRFGSARASGGPGWVLELARTGAEGAIERWAADTAASTSLETGPDPDDIALLIFTGGTTGEPKAVEHRHRSLLVSVLQHMSAWPVQEGGERFLSVAPIFHIWGLAYATFVPLYSGGTLVIVPKYDPEEVLATLEAERISIFGGGPAPVYMGLIQHPRFRETNWSSLKYCLSGGAPCPEELHREWFRQTGCALLEGWGMSEAAPLCLNRPGTPEQGVVRKLLSVGRPVVGTEVQIVDLDTGVAVQPAGQPGEVRVRGPQLMVGYRGRAEATRSALRDGWLYTGDIGYLDEDGYLFLVDRKKDMIIVGGYNVYPRQVDEVLFSHPAIAEVACVGRADARLGEVLVAFVVRKVGVGLTEAEFFRYCESQLVKYRRPVAVHFVDALPRTNARKLDKKALRARAEQSGETGSREPASVR